MKMNTVSDMLRMFRTGTTQYEPAGLAPETGDPQTALENINRLLATGLLISQIHVRPTGSFFLFATGEQYYTPALRVGHPGRETEILAEIATSIGWGDPERLLACYASIPADYVGALPDARDDREDP
ncbi:MAG: hypothetical protein ACYDH4_11240 [Candidatus Cryosericum sp.]